MADRTIYTRTYSSTSAGELVSAKGSKGHPLSNIALLEEFQNHSNQRNEEPTALVSASVRIIDTLKRAFDKYHLDGESPADIWIAFIEIPSDTDDNAARIHSAKELAEKCKLCESSKFLYEVVFEWAIPEVYVVHKVSLQTLMNRRLQERYLLESSTGKVRQYFAREFQRLDSFEIGLTLGVFAQMFGARAPLHWISYQLFDDCVRSNILDDDVVRLHYAHNHTKIVDFQFFFDRDDGIETSLYDWWLTDTGFLLDYEEFDEWRDVTEDSMTEELIECWETWHLVNCDATFIQLSAKEQLSYDAAKNKVLIEHAKKKALIEREAVRIGL